MSQISAIKQQALEKMLKEMSGDHTSAEDRLHNHLCDQTDDWLFIGVLKEGKSIKKAFEYCKNKAKDMAESGVAVVEDDVVFSWTREYFLNEEEIEPKEKPIETVKKADKKTKKAKEEPKEQQLSLFDFG